ncbi:hypothetical protein G9A89_023163 [Geosiphon pyriformis]|nr:hypothetical protein G9A89_023163 [Geosiphon pyriformis]
MKATASSTAPKKKAPKSAFQGPTGGFFSQKKKIVLGNVKHFGDEKDISLSKAGSSGSVYSDVESLSGEDENVSMSGTNDGFLLGSAATTPKANLSAVEDDLAMAKTQLIRKIFSTINGFGGATTPSKFEGIIRLTFTSEKSMEMTTLLARENKIVINTDLKKQEVHLDQAVVIKEIRMNMSKDMIVAAVAEFGEIKSIRIQLIRMWQKAVIEFAESSQANLLASKWSFLIGKDSVCVAKAVGNCNV